MTNPTPAAIPPKLTDQQLITAVSEATKVTFAVQISRLLVDTVDEDGNDYTDEQINGQLNHWFDEVVGEYDKTLTTIIQRMLVNQAPVPAEGISLQVVDGQEN